MKQKTTPAAVVVKSSPRDSPSGPATGEHPWCYSLGLGWRGASLWARLCLVEEHGALTAPSLPKEPPVPPLLLDPDKPMGIAMSVPEGQKTSEPGRLDQLRPQELPRAKEMGAAPAEKPRLSDGHPGKKGLSILSYVRGPLPKDIPVPLSHSMNGKSKPWEPFIAEEFAHQFHESVLQSTQKALQKHKGKGRDVGSWLGTTGVTSIWDRGSALSPPLGFGTTEGTKSSGNLVAGASLKLIDEAKGKAVGSQQDSMLPVLEGGLRESWRGTLY